MKRPLALLAIAALPWALVACGGDDDGGDAGGADSDFCTLAKAADSSSDDASTALDTADPAKIEEALNAALADAERAAEIAPDDIKAAVEKVVDGQRQLIEGLERNDWDILAAIGDEDFAALIEDPSFQEASNELEAYLETTCGITPETDPEVTDDTTAAGGTTGFELSDDPEAALDQFLQLYEIGSGTELTDEQRTCLKDALREDLSSEDLASVVNGGGVSDEVTTAVGLAFVTCGATPGG
jgi:hypothetical protein